MTEQTAESNRRKLNKRALRAAQDFMLTHEDVILAFAEARNEAHRLGMRVEDCTINFDFVNGAITTLFALVAALESVLGEGIDNPKPVC